MTLLVVAAAVIGVRGVLPRRAHTVVGSSTAEFVPAASPPAKPRAPGVAWPTYGFDAARARTASFALRPPFRQRWVFHGRTLLEFPPAVAYGRVFLSTFDGRFYALSTATGDIVWSHRSARCGWASPAVARHLVYVTFIGSSECRSRRPGGELDAYDASTGRVRWRRELGPTESSPLVIDGEVVVGDWNGDVWSFSAQTGRTLWRARASGAVKGSLAFGGGRLYIGTYGGRVYALAPRTGRTLWVSRGYGRFYSSPTVAYGRVFIGSLDDGVYAFGATTGHLLWSRPTGGYVYASPAVAHRRVLIGSYDHHFYALDAATGQVRWQYDAGDRISGAASVIDGVVYFSTFGERTFALDSHSGKVLERWNDGKYSPAVADANQLYLVGLGRLYALTARAGAR
jgi:outer membrane protein assembly factor BamB